MNDIYGYKNKCQSFSHTDYEWSKRHHIHILNIESRPAHGSQWKTALEAKECPFTVICRK